MFVYCVFVGLLSAYLGLLVLVWVGCLVLVVIVGYFDCGLVICLIAVEVCWFWIVC